MAITVSLYNYALHYPNSMAIKEVEEHLKENQNLGRDGLIFGLIFGILMALAVLYSSTPRFLTKKIVAGLCFLPAVAYLMGYLSATYELHKRRPLIELQERYPSVRREGRV